MARAVLFIEGEVRGSKGLHAPKRNSGTAAWAKDVLKLFARELAADGKGYENLRWDRVYNQSVTAEEIRFLWVVKDVHIGIIVDRTANALAT